MPLLKTFLTLVIFVQFTASAQVLIKPETATNSKSPYELVIIPESQNVIEEKSLIFQSGAFASAQSQTLPGSAPTGSNSRMTERTEDMPNALRCYGFLLEAGEKLRLHLEGKTEGHICMKFLPKANLDSMTSQVRRANMAPAPIRQSKIEITNITDKPYLVALMLFGQANYPYILEIERKPKK